MKKLSLIIAVLCLSSIFTACGNNAENKENVDNTTINQLQLIEKADNYKVYGYSYGDLLYDYLYFINDKDGNKIDSGSYEKYCPQFEKLSNKILKKSVSFGMDASVEQYYDLDNATVSKEFQGVCYDDDKTVAYINFKKGKACLFIQEIFSDDCLAYKEYDANVITSSGIDVDIKDDVAIVKYETKSQKDKVVDKIPLK